MTPQSNLLNKQCAFLKRTVLHFKHNFELKGQSHPEHTFICLQGFPSYITPDCIFQVEASLLKKTCCNILRTIVLHNKEHFKKCN